MRKGTYMWEQRNICVEKDWLNLYEKRPIYVKEAYLRDPHRVVHHAAPNFLWQFAVYSYEKKNMYGKEETHVCEKRPIYVKRVVYMLKETLYMGMREVETEKRRTYVKEKN